MFYPFQVTLHCSILFILSLFYQFKASTITTKQRSAVERFRVLLALNAQYNISMKTVITLPRNSLNGSYHVLEIARKYETATIAFSQNAFTTNLCKFRNRFIVLVSMQFSFLRMKLYVPYNSNFDKILLQLLQIGAGWICIVNKKP